METFCGQLPGLEYEALRAEERDRMNARLQIWGIYLSLVGAFGLASLQNGDVAYVIALFPFLVACLALYTRHSEDVLKTIRKYLYELEKKYGYSGYEHFTRSLPRSSHGGHVDALRYAFAISQALAVGIVVYRLVVDHAAGVIILGTLGIEFVAFVMTWRWLSKQKSSKKGAAK